MSQIIEVASGKSDRAYLQDAEMILREKTLSTKAFAHITRGLRHESVHRRLEHNAQRDSLPKIISLVHIKVHDALHPRAEHVCNGHGGEHG